MHRGTLCIVSALFACAACGPVRSGESAAPPATKSPAASADRSSGSATAKYGATEYAFRWILPGDGLETAQQVIDVLRGSASGSGPDGSAKTRTIVYYRLTGTGPLPERYEASLRQRSERKRDEDIYEYTYKVRGPAPRPSSLQPPSICATISSPVVEETDFTVRAEEAHATQPNASLSCSIETRSAQVPKEFRGLSPEPRACVITMARSKVEWATVPRFADVSSNEREAIKIEAWTFKPPAADPRALLEVSWKGSADPADASAFRKLVQPLFGGADDSAPPSKENMAEQCDSGHWEPPIAASFPFEGKS